MAEHEIGQVEHFFKNLQVASLELHEDLKVGDRIHIHGHTTDLYETVDSMEIEHHQVSVAHPGESVAIRVPERCREHDEVLMIQ